MDTGRLLLSLYISNTYTMYVGFTTLPTVSSRPRHGLTVFTVGEKYKTEARKSEIDETTTKIYKRKILSNIET